MCLFLDTEDTLHFLRKNIRERIDNFTVLKVVDIANGNLYSPYKNYIWKEGENISDSEDISVYPILKNETWWSRNVTGSTTDKAKSDLRDMRDTTYYTVSVEQIDLISKGFHAYLNNKYSRTLEVCALHIIKLQVKTEDVIAVNYHHGEIVFTKAYLHPHEVQIALYKRSQDVSND